MNRVATESAHELQRRRPADWPALLAEERLLSGLATAAQHVAGLRCAPIALKSFSKTARCLSARFVELSHLAEELNAAQVGLTGLLSCADASSSPARIESACTRLIDAAKNMLRWTRAMSALQPHARLLPAVIRVRGLGERAVNRVAILASAVGEAARGQTPVSLHAFQASLETEFAEVANLTRDIQTVIWFRNVELGLLWAGVAAIAWWVTHM